MAIPLHILVVDDEPEITAWLKEVLERLGHRAETASSGTEALNFINAALRANDRYQLLLLDVHLPLLDGLGVVRELRRNKDYTDVALFTGNHALLPQLDVEAQRHGCLMVLPKPIDTAQLAQLLEFVGLRQGRAMAPPPTASPLPPPPGSHVSPSPSPLAPAGPPAPQEPQRGYDPSQQQHSDSAEYLPTSTRQQQTPRPETQVQRNASRTQQFFQADGQQAAPTGYGGAQRAPGLPVVPQGLPPVPGTNYSEPPRPPSRQVAPPVAQQPQRPAYPSPPPAAPPQRPAYPSPPPAAPPAGPPAQNGQFVQRDPRYTSRTAPPAGYDPRQTQGLPPVPSAPVAQPPARDARLSSGALPPGTTPYQAPADPRRSSRVMPPAPPMAPQVPQQRAPDPRRTSGVQPPVAPRRATPIDDPGASTAGYQPQTAPVRPPSETDAAQSSRLRRTVVGSATPPPPTEGTGGIERSRMVACAYCRGSFRAVLKPTPYNLVCVHCGQLNRIDP